MDNALKILHVDSESGWRGGQQQAIYLFEHMLQLGYQTEFVCQPDSDLEMYCFENKLPFKLIRFHSELDFISGYKLGYYASKKGYRILQLHSGHALSWGLWAKLFFPKLILVATRRVDFSIKKNLFSRFKYTTSWLNKIVCISNNIQHVLLSDGIPYDKTHVILSGINCNKYASIPKDITYKTKWNIPEDALVIGTVAAFVGHKDYPNLLEAAKIVLGQRDNVYFMAVGDGHLFKDIKFKAFSLHMHNRFIFVGASPNVGSYLRIFDIFVLASKKEGLGTSILDAQTLGLPVVATQAGGIPEMIDNGINGLLVPIRDPLALANALLRLIDNKELRDRIGKNAKEMVNRFDIKITVKEYLKLYQELIDESKKN